MLLRAFDKMGFATLCLLFVGHQFLSHTTVGPVRGGEPRIMRAEWEALHSRQRLALLSIIHYSTRLH